jgi:alkylation response protein AidB-like acyl-CoA dehydrogenase
MNFDWTAVDGDFKARVAGYCDKASRNEFEELEDTGTEAIRTVTSRHLRRLSEVGYLSPGVGPAAFSEILHLTAGQEELARASRSLFLAVETSVRLFGGLVKGFGQSLPCREISERISRGEAIGAVAVSEPSEPAAQADLRTVGWLDGDDVIVTGKKSFVTNGPIADHIAVSAHVDGKPAIVVVRPDMPGLTIGSRLQTLGYNGIAVAELTLEGVRVPKSMMLGPFADTRPLEWLRSVEDRILVMASLGLMQATVAQAKIHAGSHMREGKPILAHQEIRFKLAEMLTLTQTAQLLAYRSGWMSANADPEAATLGRVAKVFAAEASEQVAAMGMQIMAGRGYLKGNTIERAYRDAKYAALSGTTSERARMSIAEDLLKRNQV